jgi:hypothetical protein
LESKTNCWGGRPCWLSPELDELEDGLGLLAFAQIGIGVAEDLTLGFLGQEGQDAGLAAAPLR